jgi:hypothetical protein
MVLAPIGEDYEVIEDFVSEDEVTATKMKTATLAAAAKRELMELSALLGKLNTGTATRNEKDRVVSLNAKLSVMKKEVELAKERESLTELKMLRSTTRIKTTQLQVAVKQKNIQSAIRAICEAESVDLAFFIDCTGSMTKYINSVKQNILDIIRRISKTSGNLKLRLAIVGYRGVRDMSHPGRLVFTSYPQLTNLKVSWERFLHGAEMAGLQTWLEA